jgi:hypothetical protein
MEVRNDMSGPLIFVATNKLRPGKFEAERERLPGFVDYIEASEPRLIAFNQYVNADRTEASVVQVHPDAASMEFHLDVVRSHARRAFEETHAGTTRIQLFGHATDAILDALDAYTVDGVEVTASPQHMGGFTRTRAAD